MDTKVIIPGDLNKNKNQINKRFAVFMDDNKEDIKNNIDEDIEHFLIEYKRLTKNNKCEHCKNIFIELNKYYNKIEYHFEDNKNIKKLDSDSDITIKNLKINTNIDKNVKPITRDEVIHDNNFEFTFNTPKVEIPIPKINNILVEETFQYKDLMNKLHDKQTELNELKEHFNNKYKNSEVIKFMNSENKIIIKFQGMLAEKIGNDDELWKEIYDCKIKYGELKDSSTAKTRFQRKIIRSKFLYDKYSERLSKFGIYMSHLAEMENDVWEEWLIQFDDLFRKNYNESLCKFSYKNGKICNRINCDIKHRESH